MRRATGIRGAGLAVLCALGCTPSLPTAPSDLTTGVIIYEHVDFMGASAHVTEDIADLRDFDGPCEHFSPGSGGPFGQGVPGGTEYDWNDCISSVRVAPGWTVTLYRDDNYRDDRITISRDFPNLQQAAHDCPKGGLNDCVTSIRVSGPH